MEIKKTGNITAITIIVLLFITFTVFSISFLISQETELLRDKKNYLIKENKQNIIENIFDCYIKNIEKEINSNDKIFDIIDYIIKCEEKIIFLNNYENEPVSYSGFAIENINIVLYNGKKEFIDFSNWKYKYSYARIIKNFSFSNYENICFITFTKKENSFSVEGIKTKFNLTIKGTIKIKYSFNKEFTEKSLLECKLKELSFYVQEI